MRGSVDITDNGLFLDGVIAQSLEFPTKSHISPSVFMFDGEATVTFVEETNTIAILSAGGTIISATTNLDSPSLDIALDMVRCQRHQLVLKSQYVRAVKVFVSVLLFYVPIPNIIRANPTIEGNLQIQCLYNTEAEQGFSFHAENCGNVLKISAYKNFHGLSDAQLFIPDGTIFNANL